MSQRISSRINTFGKYVAYRREELGCTASELADSVPVARSTFCDVEKGRRVPALRNARRWALALKIATADVVALLLQQRVNEAKLALVVEVSEP